MELPTVRRKAISLNPSTLLLYSAPKSGKTTIVAQLEEALLIEHEAHGADFIDAMTLQIDNPGQLRELFKTIRDGGKPYKYLIVDTITKWDE